MNIEVSRELHNLCYRNGNIFPIHTLKAYIGSSGVAPILLNLGCTWGEVVTFTSRPLDPKERTPASIEQKAD
jgi:hypothetical protein